MSIQNFPRIPKIILKKSAEQVKDTKNEKVSFFRANVSDPITRLAKPLYNGTLHIFYRHASKHEPEGSKKSQNDKNTPDLARNGPSL